MVLIRTFVANQVNVAITRFGSFFTQKNWIFGRNSAKKTLLAEIRPKKLAVGGSALGSLFECQVVKSWVSDKVTYWAVLDS